MNAYLHRSLDGSQTHPGFVDECVECTARHGRHNPDSHHPFAPVSMAGLGGDGWCVCGGEEYTALHDRPYCADCEVPEPDEFGEPAPWWSRLWCRLVARFGGRS